MLIKSLLVIFASFLLIACQSTPYNPTMDRDPEQLVETIIEELTSSGFLDDGRLFGGGMVGGLQTSTPFEKIKPILNRIDQAQTSAERNIAILELSEYLVDTGLVSHVFFHTPTDGAVIKYHLVSDDQAVTVDKKTNSIEPLVLNIGVYHIWSERDGRPTSPPETQYHITNKIVDLELE